MGIILNDNLSINLGKPLDSKYLNISTPWNSISQVNANIPQSYRYSGLTVNILGKEYWYSNGIGDDDLVLKSFGGGIGDAVNGIHVVNGETGTALSLGGILTGDTVFYGGNEKYTLQYANNYATNYNLRSLVDKEYVDSVATGVRPKQAVVVATVDNIALSGLIIVDGIQLQSGDRVLVKDQNNQINNGVYSASTGNWGRTSDFDNIPSGEVLSGIYLFVLNGNTNKNHAFTLITPNPITVGVDKLIFTPFYYLLPVISGTGIIISQTGNGQEVNFDGSNVAGTCLSWDGSQLGVNSLTAGIINRGITGATNGIRKYNLHNISLGGQLTGDTVLTIPYSSKTCFAIGNGVLGDIAASSDWYGGNLVLYRDNVLAGKNMTFLGVRSDAQNNNFICGKPISGIAFSSTISNITHSLMLADNALAYDACYHNDYNFRSLVDKEYVDSSTSNIIGGNGLTRCHNYITLGGTLTGDTYILGSNSTTLHIGGNAENLNSFCVTTNNDINFHSKCLNISTFSGGTFQDMSSVPSGLKYSKCYHSTYENRSLVDKEYVDNKISSYSATTVFDSDILVSLCEGKTFGRYCNGDTIPAIGKTPAEIIMMAVIEPIPPSVNLTSHSNIVAFGATEKIVNLDFSYIINSLSAGISSVLLEYKRGENAHWNTLTNDTNLIAYMHVINDTANRFNTTLLEYRYTVTDTLNAVAIATHNVVLQPYAAPSISSFYTGSIQAYETQAIRETGNVNTTITGNIGSNRLLVKINKYSIERSINGGAYSSIDSLENIGLQEVSINTYLDIPSIKNAECISYKIVVDDEYTRTTSSVYTINYRFASYFGYSATCPLDSTGIKLLGNAALCLSRERYFNGVSASSDKYTFYSYPSGYGNLSNVILDGVTSVLGAFSKQSNVIVTNRYNQITGNIVYASNATGAFTNNCLSFS